MYKFETQRSKDLKVYKNIVLARAELSRLINLGELQPPYNTKLGELLDKALAIIEGVGDESRG